MSTDQTGGTSGYRGYEYQILVTVWLALKLMLERRVCGEIEVEPASNEDIEARLDVPSNSATGLLHLATDQVELDVQVKSRDSGHWTPSEFWKVLTGAGPKRARSPKEWTQQSAGIKRLRPLDRLREVPARRYVFVTNAQLHPQLRDFSVKNIGAESVARRLPVSKQPADATKLARRIGVLAQQTREYLELQTENLLHRYGHVQPSRTRGCLTDLQNAVRHRLLKEVSGVWKRDELEAILRVHGGLPPPPRELVPPANMSEIRARLEAGRLILTGPSGTGKTFVAEHLEHEHRTAEEHFEIVTGNAGIDHIRRCLEEPGRHLFVFGDPWGHYRLEPDADFWRSELPKLFRHASPEKRFLVTSRTAVKAQALGDAVPTAFNEAEVAITPEHYSLESRKRILALQMRGAGAWQRELVEREESRIVRELGAPLSLQEFADALSHEKNESQVKLDDLIRRSNVEVISRTCAEEVKALGAESVAAGVALWSLFMTQGTVSESMAHTLRQQLEEGGYRDNIDPLQLLRWLQKAGRLVPATGGFSMHPTVMQGLEMLIDGEPARAERVLSAQLRSLATRGSGADLEMLAKFITTRNLPIPAAAQVSLNKHLENLVLALDGPAWQQAFRALAKFSTGDAAVALLVRSIQPVEIEGLSGFEQWQPLSLNPAEIATIRATPETRQIAVKFIRLFLTNDQMFNCKAKELSEFFAQFGWDFSGEFLGIVIEALKQERPLAMDLFVESALLTREPHFDELINAALSALDAVEAWHAGFKEEVRQAEQCETDAAHASHVDELPGDRYWPVQTALKIAVAARRRHQGYDWLLQHSRRGDLLWRWAESLSEGVTDAELMALRDICESGDQGPFWKAVETAGRKDWAVKVASGLASAPEEHLGACLGTLAKILNAEEWEALLEQRAPGLSLPRRLMLAIASFHEDGTREKRRLLRAAFFNPEQLHALELCLDEGKAPSASPVPKVISEQERDFLEQITRQGPDRLAVEALRVLDTPAKLTAERLPHLLASPSMHTRHNALLLAAKAKGFDGRPVLLNALRDEDYRCRRLALRLLAEGANAEEKKRILSMANDASAPVRLACAEIIAEHRWHDGEQELTKLIHDTRDASENAGFRFGMPNYHVARTAARALKDLSPLSSDSISEIIACIESSCSTETRSGTRDIGVPYELLLSLAKERTAEISNLYLRRLRDAWYVEGTEQSGYPLRFAAAWGLVVQLSHTPALRAQIDPAALVEGAGHTDDRIAGPCLVALGMLGNRALEQLIRLKASPEFTRECALIVATALPKAAKASRKALASALPPDSPQERFLAWANQNATAPPEVAERFLAEQPGVAAWMERIQAREGIFPELRCVLHMFFAKPFGAKLQYDDLLPRHLPKSIPVLTTRSMFGGE